MARGPQETTHRQKVIREPMITIVEPKEAIAKLWGKQKVRESDTYRLMRYVLRVDHEGKVLLHNVVTGQLVVLSEEEARALDQLPSAYTPTMEQLVSEHYLVPETFDEHQQVVNLRSILFRMFDAQQSRDIIHYTILPTTACNARCYYCFEQGCETVTMTEETANDLVNFIASHCGGKEVRLSWFGGEPTLATRRIDQICEGLQRKNIEFVSDMTTNGYLFDEEMVNRAAALWHLDHLMICVDGTETNYNKIKAFPNVEGSPYQRVMRNIDLLLDKGIRVHLRMNFDLGNYTDLPDLIHEVISRFHKNPNLYLSVHPLFGEHRDYEGRILHADETWFDQQIVELNALLESAGLLEQSEELPCLEFTGCQATSHGSVAITAKGDLIRCPEQFGDDQVAGNIIDGLTNSSIIEYWKEMANYDKCYDCCLFPICERHAHCLVKDLCCHYSSLLLQFQKTLERAHDRWKVKEDD